MAAPGGMCESCGGPMQWTTMDTQLWVRCPRCADLFEIPGTEVASEVREGSEAEATSMFNAGPGLDPLAECQFPRTMQEVLNGEW